MKTIIYFVLYTKYISEHYLYMFGYSIRYFKSAPTINNNMASSIKAWCINTKWLKVLLQYVRRLWGDNVEMKMCIIFFFQIRHRFRETAFLYLYIISTSWQVSALRVCGSRGCLIRTVVPVIITRRNFLIKLREYHNLYPARRLPYRRVFKKGASLSARNKHCHGVWACWCPIR